MLNISHDFFIKSKALNTISTIIIILIATSSATQSGIYIDNGVDQTVMHRLLSNDDKVSVAFEILEFLGLAKRPILKSGRPMSLKKSAPKFLLDVYHRITEDEDVDIEHGRTRTRRDAQGHENFITTLDKRAIKESDIIMTFLNKKNPNISEMRHLHGQRLWFDITSIPSDNFLMMAELRIYQSSKKDKWVSSDKIFIITVYVIKGTFSGKQKLEPLCSVQTTANYTGWLELNVTEGVNYWLINSKNNYGIYIGAHAVNKTDREVKLNDIGIMRYKTDDEYQPFMIGFLRGPELIKSVHHREKRSTSHLRKKKKSEIVNPFKEIPIENLRSCQMQTLYIDFKDLGWHDWIIAPDGYGAFYCSGECNFPLNAHMNATNHAIVQTLVHLLEPKKVPKPCCAPTKLGALPVLYHLNDENVNLKKYRNMIVKSCGCH